MSTTIHATFGGSRSQQTIPPAGPPSLEPLPELSGCPGLAHAVIRQLHKSTFTEDRCPCLLSTRCPEAA
eukprot:6378000-Alexandrium_andersonii.AAC.1